MLVWLLVLCLLGVSFGQGNPFRDLPAFVPVEEVVVGGDVPPPLVDVGAPPPLPVPGRLSMLPPVIVIPLEPVVFGLPGRLPLSIVTSTPAPQSPQFEPVVVFEIVLWPTPEFVAVVDVDGVVDGVVDSLNDGVVDSVVDGDVPVADVVNVVLAESIVTLAVSRGANATALLRLNDVTKLVRDGESILDWGVTVRISGDGVTFETVP
jgi:molybdopterin-binding protein